VLGFEGPDVLKETEGGGEAGMRERKEKHDGRGRGREEGGGCEREERGGRR
jgi:hypothetical protein